MQTGIPFEFILFALTLLGIAMFHRHTLPIAVGGLIAIVTYKWFGPGFNEGAGLAGLVAHFGHEWVLLANLLCLLLGFALLARCFEDSRAPLLLPKYLPDNWTGALSLLVLVFVISSFLDNIAAALIGGAMAHALFRGKVHIGYLAALVAASNAGGAGSVVGDTTTTMMWISGIGPLEVLHAYIGSLVALAVFGVPAALVQQRYSPIMRDAQPVTMDWARLAIVAFVLGCAIATNVAVNLQPGSLGDRFPFIGVAVVVALLASTLFRPLEWRLLPGALLSSIFLLSLVACASLMPVDRLPEASSLTAFGLGFVSAVFDNIPLTALALRQGGYDWGMLAYAVGFGGSMIWFGSSAGVALSTQFPEARSTKLWLKHGWFVAVAYVAGFAVLELLFGR